MGMNKKRVIINCVLALGVALVLFSVVFVALDYINQKSQIEENAETVSTLKSLMPEPQNGVFNSLLNPEMPRQEVNGDDYAGIIEIPLYGTELPIYAEWNESKVDDFPCRYAGSVYNKTLIIGGTDSEGQFDFTKSISVGDKAFITDTSGAKFGFSVANIDITDDIDQAISKNGSDLMLFVKNSYSFDYTVIYFTAN